MCLRRNKSIFSRTNCMLENLVLIMSFPQATTGINIWLDCRVHVRDERGVNLEEMAENYIRERCLSWNMRAFSC